MGCGKSYSSSKALRGAAAAGAAAGLGALPFEAAQTRIFETTWPVAYNWCANQDDNHACCGHVTSYSERIIHVCTDYSLVWNVLHAQKREFCAVPKACLCSVQVLEEPQ